MPASPQSRFLTPIEMTKLRKCIIETNYQAVDPGFNQAVDPGLQTIAKGSTIHGMTLSEHIPPLERLIKKAKQDPLVLSVILFGSRARGEATPASDVDVCLVLLNQRYDPLTLSREKLEYLKIGEVDVHVFQQLPLYIRRRVLKEGKILFTRDEESLYELAFRTAQAFEDFKHHYHDYLEEIARVGS